MKVLLDENLSWKHATRLRQDGHDAVTVSELGLGGSDDATVRARSIEEDRILLTLDADFGNILRFPPEGTPGVIWLRLHPPTEERIANAIDRAVQALASIDVRGRLMVVDDHKIRIRGPIRGS